MILEHAVLDVRPGLEAALESAFAEAVAFISAAPGFVDLRLERCVQNSSRYLLLVSWTSVEAHTQGFRRSAAYEQWRSLLHDFYDPFPVVQHFATVLTTAPSTLPEEL